MKKITLLLCLLLFACSSDNPVSSNAETVDGKITFEFEGPVPYRISYPTPDLSTSIIEEIHVGSNPEGMVVKTIRTFDYQFPPFSRFRFDLDLLESKGYLIIKVDIVTDSTLFSLTSKDFTANKSNLYDVVELPF